jgi:hypothetical protein
MGLAVSFIGAHIGRAHAAPMDSGVFWVSTTADNTNADWDLSLREAIILTIGGTGPSGLNRGLTDQELTHIGGSCSFDSSGYLFTCGPGYANTILFLNTLGSHPTIKLASNQPLQGLVNPKGTTIDGSYSNIYPIIDASAIGANGDGLLVGGNSAIVGITVKGAPGWDFNVYGDNNTLTSVNAWKAGQEGIFIHHGSNNTVDGALVGVASTATTSCTANSGNGNSGNGITIMTINGSSASGNTIKNSRIGCNAGSGVSLTGGTATGNVIGPNDLIGAGQAGGGTDLGNDGDGVAIAGGANHNSILASTLANNGGSGLSIADAGNTQVGGNSIRQNLEDGVYISGIAQNNQIGGPTFGSALTGNNIGANHRNGIELTGGQVRFTVVAGNGIGTNATTGASDPNNFNGVVVDGAVNNIIGDNAAAVNSIGGNKLDGVLLEDGARGNSVAHNRIGLAYGSNAARPNILYGVVLNSGAHDNTLAGNFINWSGVIGVVIRNSTTASNTLTSNYVESSGSSGIAVRDGAFNNTIGTPAAPNIIDANNGNGVEISGGAHDNRVAGDSIDNNALNGVWLTGNGTAGNVITGTSFGGNGGDGLNASGGAGYNVWSHLHTGNNGHMGLNVAPPSAYTPIISTRLVTSKGITLTGRVLDAGFFTSVVVEGYLVYFNAHGFPEIDYWGSTSADQNGSWGISRLGLLYGGASTCFVAFETSTTTFFTTFSNSSSLSPDTCRALLPMVSR